MDSYFNYVFVFVWRHQIITAAIRHLLKLASPDYFRSIAEPRVDLMEYFLEAKSKTGPSYDNMTFTDFLQRNRVVLRKLFGEELIPNALSEMSMLVSSESKLYMWLWRHAMCCLANHDQAFPKFLILIKYNKSESGKLCYITIHVHVYMQILSFKNHRYKMTSRVTKCEKLR